MKTASITTAMTCSVQVLALVSAVAAADTMKEDPSSTYNFLAIGDWGNDSPGQKANAEGMGKVAAELNATAMFVLGDNFYTSGIHPTDGPDGMYRFKKTFEDVYTAPSLKNIPFYAIAGNHDHGGNVSAEIAYSQSAQNVGGRWKMPYWYHNITERFEVGGKTVELEVLLFDSVIMTGNTDVYHADGTVTEMKLAELEAKGAPTDPLAKEQLDWLMGRMANSTADYLWVGGHYPVWAIGQDPPTGIRQDLRDALNKWEAQYFNGHEHDFEHIVEEGSKVNYISTGAGMFCCYADKNLDTVPVNSIKFATSGRGGAEWWGGVKPPPYEILAGFTSYRVGPDSMKVYYHTHNGDVLYVTPPILPRTKQPQPPLPQPSAFCTDATCPHTTRESMPQEE